MLAITSIEPIGPPIEVADICRHLGKPIRIARLQRYWRQQDIFCKSRFGDDDLEKVELIFRVMPEGDGLKVLRDQIYLDRAHPPKVGNYSIALAWCGAAIISLICFI